MNSINSLSNKDKVLDISVNLARVSDWIFSETKNSRVDQFLTETKEYLSSMNSKDVSDKFRPTLISFKKEFEKLLKEKDSIGKEEWAEKALTWANILQHRASIA